MRVASDRSASMATGIGGALAAGRPPADYAMMLRWLKGTSSSDNSSRPNGDIEKVTGRPLITFQDFAGRNAHGMDPSGGQVTTPSRVRRCQLWWCAAH